MSKNPHPDAGLPAHVNEVGAVYVCIPCLVKNRGAWASRAHLAESALSSIRALADALFPAKASASGDVQGGDGGQ